VNRSCCLLLWLSGFVHMQGPARLLLESAESIALLGLCCDAGALLGSQCTLYRAGGLIA
jgi:hypothetical protein